MTLCAAAVLTFGLLSCVPEATPAEVFERQADWAKWARATKIALDLTDYRWTDVVPVQVRSRPIGELCDPTGRCPHIAVFHRWLNEHGHRRGAAYFRDDLDYREPRGFAAMVHEAVHALQPHDMDSGCRELEAHDVQVQWLESTGQHAYAGQVRENAQRYRCGDADAGV